MRKIITMMGLTMILVSPLFAGELDSSAWHVYQKGKKEVTDTLLFVNGQFTSSECVPYGFVTGAYSTSKNNNKTMWMATQMNPANEKMEWKGEVNGMDMAGSYIYVDKNGKSSTTEWTAKKAQPK